MINHLQLGFCFQLMYGYGSYILLRIMFQAFVSYFKQRPVKRESDVLCVNKHLTVQHLDHQLRNTTHKNISKDDLD